MQNPRARHRLSWGKLPLLRGLHGLAGKIFTRPRRNEAALHVARGIHQNLYPDLDGAGNSVLRRPGHNRLHLLQNSARIGVGGGCRAGHRAARVKARRLWNSDALRALVAEGLAASAGGGSAFGRRSGLQARNRFQKGRGVRGNRTCGCASGEWNSLGPINRAPPLPVPRRRQEERTATSRTPRVSLPSKAAANSMARTAAV